MNPETGRVETPESNAKYRLSEWALDYERDRGQVLCKVREENALRRENGLPYEQYRDEARPAYEAEQTVARAAERHPEAAEKLRASLKEHVAGQAAATREMRERQEAQWTKLFKDHEFRKAMINQEADDGKGYADRAVRMSFVDRFDQLRDQQSAEQAQFVEREASFFGRLTNVGTAARQVWASRREDGEQESQEGSTVVGDTWNVIANSGARLEALKAAQEKAKTSLDKEMQTDIRAALDTVERGRKEAIHDNYERLQREKTDLGLETGMEKAADRAAWRQLDSDRVKAWRSFELEHDYEAAAARAEADAKRRREDADRPLDREFEAVVRDSMPDGARAFDSGLSQSGDTGSTGSVRSSPAPSERAQPEPSQERTRERRIDDG